MSSGLIGYESSLTSLVIAPFNLTVTPLFRVKVMIAFVIPDEPQEVDLQLKRQDFIRSKVQTSARDKRRQVSDHHIAPNYVINTTDDDPL